MTSRSTIVGITRQSPSEPDFADNGDTLGISLANTDDDPLILSDADAEIPETSYYDDYEEASSSALNWKAYIWPSAIGITLAGWTGYFAWAHRAENIQALTNERFISLLGNWSLPVSLIGVAWLIMMRSSRAEATRFADVSTLLRTESTALEQKMRTVNEEISMARGFLAENARELESVGRSSAKKLQQAAEQLGIALADSDAKAKTLEQVSNAATTNLEQLRKHLPVVTSAAKDVTNQIGNAGNSAQLQVKTLIASLQRVAVAGQTARGNIDGLEERAGEASVQLSHLISQNTVALENSIKVASDRTEQLSALLNNASAKLNNQLQSDLETTQAGVNDMADVLAVAAKNVEEQLNNSTEIADERVHQLAELLERASQNVANRLATAHDEAIAKTQNLSNVMDDAAKVVAQNFADAATSADAHAQKITLTLTEATKNVEDRLVATGTQIDDVSDRNIARLTQQVEMLRESLNEMQKHSKAEDVRIDAMIQRTSDHIEEKAKQLSVLDEQSTERTATLAFSVEALVASTRNLNENLSTNHSATDALIERSERLLLALDSASREIDETMPAALNRADERLVSSITQLDVAAQKASMLDEHSDNMLAKLITIEKLVNAQRDTVGTLMASSDAHFTERQEQVDALATSLIETRAMLVDVADKANTDLVEALHRVRASSQEAAEASRALIEDGMTNAADRISEQSRIVLSAAIDEQVNALNDVVKQSFERNISLSETATQKVTSQLAQLDNMTLNLETRLNAAREGFSGIDDDSFARQMVMLTESLNSTAIDVAKILSNDVTDTSWAAYLKGDRGVFTRRAVRLLDAGEAKIIATHYGDEPEFRDHVNRYIHDFESMMRILLSTRDGNAIGVTLLSSDVGKLYVALAQAIERLRN
jgi:hypothetical protein